MTYPKTLLFQHNKIFSSIRILAACWLITLLSNAALASPISHLKTTQRNEILFNIHTYYVEDLALQNSQLIDFNPSQFKRLYAKLDAYSKYLDEDELNAIFNNTNDQYTGIGIEINTFDKKVTIVNVINNSPAHYAGVLTGDIIIGVNNTSVINKEMADVAALIKHNKTDDIQLSLQRTDNLEPINLILTRQKINLNSVSHQQLGEGMGYLAISRFSNRTTDDVAAHITKLTQYASEPLKGLILDLRNNPGGTLLSAVNVADLFLQNGTIVSTKGRYDDANQTFLAHQGDIINGIPIVVLINENSASAAEILAAALKDNNRATLVGSQSFGKGSVQSLIPLGNGSTAIKLTTAKYFTPLGHSIDGVGITPDVPINQSMLSQTDKVVIIKQKRVINTQLKNGQPFDKPLVKAKQLLSMK
ncbi:S41 family peptidase [Pseudoalteromonas sp. MMG010]|uniref:S41 family peptidase n=1 Tax=Pseudoalteromonas sp. MMG010 TaxID=2822685 RepID=UPI001B39F6CA|nr:S41 family peptidase [Pseudoalteromonas sp. MMG010]MBQ4834257.1 S41 family peptidase [Pseudoalteromonas sp. MMG010]